MVHRTTIGSTRPLLLITVALAACTPAVVEEYDPFDFAQETESGLRVGSYVAVRLDDYFDNDGIGSSTDQPDGNFDIPAANNGDTFPPQGMPEGGALFRPAGFASAAMLFPPYADGQYNNISCDGDFVSFDEGAYRALLILGASEGDSQEATIAVAGADGDRTELPLKLTDWCQEAKYGEAAVLKWAYRLDTRARREATPCALFVQVVELPAEGRFNGVELPANPRVHVFGISLSDWPVAIDRDELAAVPTLEYAAPPEPELPPLRRLRPPPPPPDDFAAPGAGMTTVTLAPIVTDAPQRWADVAGTEYAKTFRDGFEYANADVQVAYATRGATFDGALRARGLKPNFAYQLKLVGDREDEWSFETIGFLGRWLVDPAKATRTNFKDAYYRRRKDEPDLEIEAYILFDYFVTDERGEATVSFSLDSSYHVIWNRTLNHKGGPRRDDSPLRSHMITPAGAAYAEPSNEAATVDMYLEREWVNKRPARTRVRLPAGAYRASVQLTEESFHLTNKGGWARVLRGPVAFEIVDEDAVPAAE